MCSNHENAIVTAIYYTSTIQIQSCNLSYMYSEAWYVLTKMHPWVTLHRIQVYLQCALLILVSEITCCAVMFMASILSAIVKITMRADDVTL